MSDSTLTQLREERKMLVKVLNRIVLEEAHLAQKVGMEHYDFLAKVREELKVQARIDELDELMNK